jgi:PAS domain S-box-containing protein
MKHAVPTNLMLRRPGARRVLLVVAAVLYVLVCAPTSQADDPPLASAAEADYPPFSFVDDDGRATGFAVELMRAALAAMDRDVDFRLGSWSQVRSWLARGEVAALPLVGRTPERELAFDFTFPYMTLHGAIVVRRDESAVETLGDLRGREVAVMKDDNAEEFLRRTDRDLRIVTRPTFDDALRELSAGSHDAVVVQRLVALRLIQRHGLANLRVVNRPLEGFDQQFCFAVEEGDRETLSLLNEGLSVVIADGTHRRLHERWFSSAQLPAERRIVVGGDHAFPPYEFLDEDGRPAGFNVDLTRAIARELALDVEIRLGPWDEIRSAFDRGDIDVLQGMVYSARRDLLYDFSPQHSVTEYVGVVREGSAPPPASFLDLTGRHVVVQQDDIAHERLQLEGLADGATVVATQELALRELAAGRADCAIVSRHTALHWLDRHDGDDLVLGKTALVSAGYCYAVPGGRAALLSSFSDGLRVLESGGELRDIRERWLGVGQHDRPSPGAILRYSALVLVPVLIVLLGILLWSWSLRRRVAIKTNELRERNEFITTIIDNLPIGLAVNDLGAGTASYMNRGFTEIYGWPREELVDIPTFFEKVYPDPGYRAQIKSRVMEDIASGDPARMQWENVVITRSDGTRRNVTATNIPIPEQNLMISLVQDETKRRAAEARLAESEEKYRLIAQNTVDCIWVMDLDLRFTFVNPAVEPMLGYRPEEFLGTTLGDHCSPEHLQRMRVIIDERIASGPGRADAVFETVLRHEDGHEVPVEIHGTVIFDAAGTPFRLQGVTRDITERRSLEKQLRQMQKMEAVGRLAGGVAHDYNNMLSVILGYTEMLMEKTGTESPLHPDLVQIEAAAKRSRDITRQLLAFARQQTIAPIPLDLNDTVAATLKMLRRLIGEDIDLAWMPGADLSPVKVDPTQIDQILANLCVNARDAITGNGKITIETDMVEFDDAYCAEHHGFEPGEYVKLSVSDDGCGMAHATLENAFEPFYTTKAGDRGTGLGLSTVYGIVKQNGGFINVYSELGSGTTVSIYLRPHEGAVEPAPAASAQETPAGRGETVLLVEDDEAILRMSQVMLERLGYRVLAAGSPGEARSLVDEHTGAIDLMMTDVILPEMNGRELSEEMQRIRPGIRTLYMSGYTANVIAHHGVLDRGVAFIQKPFSWRDLAVKLRSMLDAAG